MKRSFSAIMRTMTQEHKFDEVMSRLSKRTRDRIILANEITDNKLQLPSIGITRALSGGLPYGSQNLFWGNKSSGKTALALGCAANAQRLGMTAAMIDAEGSFKPAWGEKMGIDVSRFPVERVGTTSAANEALQDLLSAGFEYIILDSISALLPGSFFDETELKQMEKTGQIGQFSKDMKRMLGMANYTLAEGNKQSIIAYISQVTMNIGSWGASAAMMGGKAMEHMPSCIVKVLANQSDKEAKKGKIDNGDYSFEKPIGAEVTWLINKCRGKGLHETGKYDFYFDGPHVGIDNVGEVVDLAVIMKKIKKGGSWYEIDGNNLQGKDNAVAYLRENTETFDRIWNEVLDESA